MKIETLAENICGFILMHDVLPSVDSGYNLFAHKNLFIEISQKEKEMGMRYEESQEIVDAIEHFLSMKFSDNEPKRKRSCPSVVWEFDKKRVGFDKDTFIHITQKFPKNVDDVYVINIHLQGNKSPSYKEFKEFDEFLKNLSKKNVNAWYKKKIEMM